MRAFKICLCFLLVFSLFVLPTMQRVHAVVTVSTLVGILILTVLAAMGITLVVKDMQKEAFVLQKGDSFMQSKGYSGTFSEWVAGGTDVDVALKTGFLVLAKPVVDRIKEFVDWLVPGAASDTVVNLGNGELVPSSNIFLVGTITNNRYNYAYFTPDSAIVFPNANDTFSDGINTVTCLGAYFESTGYYDSTVLTEYVYIDTPGRWQDGRNPYYFAFITDTFTNRTGTDAFTSRPGIYLVNSVSTHIEPQCVLKLDAFSTGSSEDVALIGDYDDLSQLQEQDGDNKFYISQDGQALNPSSDDLADVIGALQDALDSINQKLDVQPWTAEAAEAGTVKPDYTDFQLGDLDFSTLGALITTRFPFSIPWDLVRIFQLFNAEPVAPHWEVNLLPLDAFEGVDTTIELDLGDYPLVGQVSRWFCIIDLCLGLVFVSKKLIWTA